MGIIESFMNSVVGSSWRTSLFGLMGGMVYYFSQAGVSFPHTMAEAKQAAIAAGIFAWGRMQKDSNVSNAPRPDKEASPVK